MPQRVSVEVANDRGVNVTILWIILIVLLVLAVLGYFSRGRTAR